MLRQVLCAVALAWGLTGCAGGPQLTVSMVPGPCTGDNNNIATVRETGEEWLCATDGAKFYGSTGDVIRELPLLVSNVEERMSLPSLWVNKESFPLMLGVAAIGDMTLILEYEDGKTVSVPVKDGRYVPTFGTNIVRVHDMVNPALHKLVIPTLKDAISDVRCPSPCEVD